MVWKVEEQTLVPLFSSLEAAIKQHSAGVSGSSSTGSTFPGQGHTLAGTPVPTEAPPPGTSYFKYFLIALLVTFWYKWSVNS